jgi:hypothetical protein
MATIEMKLMSVINEVRKESSNAERSTTNTVYGSENEPMMGNRLLSLVTLIKSILLKKEKYHVEMILQLYLPTALMVRKNHERYRLL